MVKVVFVCWGNICRSPMAERVAEQRFADAGLDVEVTSAATSTEELGAPIDPRAVRTLTGGGFRTDGHEAHQITKAEIDEADLVIAMEQIHIDKMRRIFGAELPEGKVRLLSDYDPLSSPGDGVPDPWYGGQDGFTTTLEMIERAMPALVEELGSRT